MGSRHVLLALPLLMTLAAAPVCAAAETPVAPRPGADIVVYPGDLALVNEHRAFRIDKGQTRLAFNGVSR